MMKMGKSRKEELIDYIGLLKPLVGTGFKCEMEMQQALNELHGIMFVKEEKKIVVIEEDYAGVDKSVNFYRDLLGNVRVVSNSKSHCTLKSSFAIVTIIKASASNHYYRGLRADHIINNTDDENIATEMGILKNTVKKER